MDDVGFKMIEMSKGKGFLNHFGKTLVAALPKMIRTLTVVGTIAMLMVAGGIFRHNLLVLHELFHAIPDLLADILIGSVLGIGVLTLEKIFRFFQKSS